MSEPAAPEAPPDAPLRDAASVLLLRREPGQPARVLMGQRGAKAAFMPSKYVFPGGAVDPGDGALPLAAPLDPLSHARLSEANTGPTPEALAGAAIRELWEETGQVLAAPGTWNTPPADWAGFAETGGLPDPSALHLMFRAITPPGRPRRFDARFFLADAAALRSDPDDFSRACDELSHLHWVALSEARGLNLPFITEVVLAETAALLEAAGDGPLTPPPTVPFFDNSGPESRFTHLGR